MTADSKRTQMAELAEKAPELTEVRAEENKTDNK